MLLSEAHTYNNRGVQFQTLMYEICEATYSIEDSHGSNSTLAVLVLIYEVKLCFVPNQKGEYLNNGHVSRIETP